MNPEKETALYKKFPRFGEVCRVEMEKMLGASQEKLTDFIKQKLLDKKLKSPEEDFKNWNHYNWRFSVFKNLDIHKNLIKKMELLSGIIRNRMSDKIVNEENEKILIKEINEMIGF